MTKIYVESDEPVGEVEDFIEKFKIDKEFKPLARLLRRFSKRLVNAEALATDPPAALVSSAWGASFSGQHINIQVTTVPETYHPITGFRFTAKLSGSVVDTFDYNVSNVGDTFTLVADAPAGVYTVEIQAVNRFGLGVAATKTVTVSAG